MPISHRSCRVVSGLAAFAAFLIGCQDVPTEPETPSSLTATGTFTVPTSGRSLPDSGVWRTNKAGRSDSGKGRISCAGSSCTQSFTLKAVLGSDQLVQDVYSLSIHFATFNYTQSGSSTELTQLNRVQNPFEDKLLTSFYTAFKASSPNAVPKTADLLAYYASRLLDGDTTYVGKNLPKGMVLDSARVALIRLANSKGVTAKVLVEKSLLSLSGDLVRALVKAAKLDTATLFPPAPVRVLDSIRVLGDLVQGGDSVAVTGTFTWDAKWTPSAAFAVIKTATGTIEDKVVASGLKLEPASGSLILTNRVTLKAAKTASVGTDTLIVKVVGPSDTAISRTTFKVVLGDTVRPKIAFTSPSMDTAVSPSTESIVLRMEASDNRAVAQVKVNGMVLTKVPYTAAVELLLGTNTMIAEVQDEAGNVGYDTVVVRRDRSSSSTDSLKPAVTLLRPSEDTTVPSTVSNFELWWTATDNVGIGRVSLEGLEVPADAGVYKKSVALKEGANTFEIRAFDTTGNVGTRTVSIKRAADTLRLGVNHLADRTVSAETESDTLTWTVSNASRAVSATLNGNPVVAGATIGARVNLVAGSNPFILVLKDAKGETVSDTVVVVRAADLTGPSLVWVAPTTKTHAVDAATTSFTVQVKVTDPSGVESVTLNGVATAKEAGDLYSLILALPKPDGNPITVTVVAKDAKGNLSKDSVTVARKVPDGTNKPVIRLVKPTAAAGNALKYDQTTLHVEAEITDALSAIDPKSVTIGGVAATATGSVFAADVPVAATGKTTTITIKAANANGITSVLDVEVVRAADEEGPILTIKDPADKYEIPYPETTVVVKAEASDTLSGLASIKIGDTTCTSSPCVVRGVVPDASGKITVVATDKAGKSTTKSVSVTIGTDKTVPVIAAGAGAVDAIVENATASQVVSWKVTDNGPLGVSTIGVNGGAATAVVGTNGSYSTSVALAVGDNLVKINAKDAAGNSAKELTFTITRKDTVARPTFSLPGSAYVGAQTVTLSSATVGAKICYNIGTDPATPTGSSVCVVSGSKITVAATSTIRAVALATGYSPSAEVSAKYTITMPDVTLKTVKVGTVSGVIDEATHTVTVAPLTTIAGTFTVTATAAAGATVSINGKTASEAVTLTDDAATVTLTVTNGGLTGTPYTMKLQLAASGTVGYIGNTYPVKKIGTTWWMLEPLKDAEYGFKSWVEANASSTCPTGWKLPTLADWEALKDAGAALGRSSGEFWTSTLTEEDPTMAYTWLFQEKAGQSFSKAAAKCTNDANCSAQVLCVR